MRFVSTFCQETREGVRLLANNHASASKIIFLRFVNRKVRPTPNLVLSFFWIALVLLGMGMMLSSNFRNCAKSYPNETIFCGLYLFAIFSYDYLIWACSNFIRFCTHNSFRHFRLFPLFAEGPQGDLGLLHGECDGIRRFGCRGKKRISGDALKRPRRAGLPSGGNAYLFKVAGQSIE